MEGSSNAKILFCDNTLWGLVNFRGDVISYFKKKGFDIVLVAPEKEDGQMRTDRPAGVRYIPVRMKRTATDPISDLEYFLQLYRIIKRESPDYVFNYTIKPNIYGSIAAKLNHCRTTAMMTGLGYIFKADTLKARFARMLYRFGLSYTDKLMLLNADNYKFVVSRHFCKEDKAILLEGGEGVNLDKFHVYDNASDSTVFLFIGRLSWDKGYGEFVQAAKEVKSKHPEAIFRMVGSLDPAYPNNVPLETVKRDERDGWVEYMGFTRDMDVVYRQKGIVVVLPSYFEGMNRSLMEACASGKPIITTDIGGCREMVDDGGNGFLVKPRDAASLADAMLRYMRLTDEEKKRFSVNSRKLAERRFDVKKVISVYEKIIESARS